MIIISIETSCDETSVSFLEGNKILSCSTISQVIHSDFGGVVPSIAAKMHLENIKEVFLKSFKNSNLIDFKKIDYVAYTEKPGLIICLQIGKIIAETIGLFLNVPIIPCNHLLGHTYSSLIGVNEQWNFPAISLIISGGHTQVYVIYDHFKFELIGESLDDSVGECLDKVAIMMGGKYPGGPVIENLAIKGRNAYKIPIPKNDKTLDFSFSGLKSFASRELKKNNSINLEDFSYSLQEVISRVISKKIILALKKFNSQTLIITGGVIINKFLREKITSSVHSFSKNIEIFLPKTEYCNDNAAMIGLLAYYMIIKRVNY